MDEVSALGRHDEEVAFSTDIFRSLVAEELVLYRHSILRIAVFVAATRVGTTVAGTRAGRTAGTRARRTRVVA